MIIPSKIQVNSAVPLALSLKLTFTLYISTPLVGPVRGLRMLGLPEKFQITVKQNPMPGLELNLRRPGQDCCLILDGSENNYGVSIRACAAAFGSMS